MPYFLIILLINERIRRILCKYNILYSKTNLKVLVKIKKIIITKPEEVINNFNIANHCFFF